MSTNPRDRLLEIAIRLFSERGYHRVGIREIATAAETNVATISYHFGNKQGLLRAVLETLEHGRLFETGNILSPCTSKEEFRNRLTSFLTGLATSFIEQQVLFKLFFHELEQGCQDAEKEFEVAYSGLLQKLGAFLEEGKKNGFIHEANEIRLIILQLLSPLATLVQSDRSLAKYLHISLTDHALFQQLIRQLVANICS